MRKNYKTLFLLFFSLWLTLIFTTSCFVIPFHVFIHSVQGLSGDDRFKVWFGQFWLVSWFVIVKGWHATEYGILVFLCEKTLRNLTKLRRFHRIGIALAFAILFAATDEWHQTFVPGRDGCVRDVLIDSLGAFAVTIALWLHKVRE